MKWRELLDGIVSGEIPAAAHVKALYLPTIEGWESGRVWTTLDIPDEAVQPQGAVFGGYLASVADEVVGMATMTVLDDGVGFSTSDLRMQYFRPTTHGKVAVEARVINHSRSAVHIEAEFKSDEDKLLAKAFAVQKLK
jgi:uncharacterized protein (TIGR00369 family)